MNLEKIHVRACIWGRKIHVCDSENRNGKGWMEGIQLGGTGGGGQGKLLLSIPFRKKNVVGSDYASNKNRITCLLDLRCSHMYPCLHGSSPSLQNR